MRSVHRATLSIVALLSASLAGCTMLSAPGTPTAGAEAYAATISAMQTRAVQTATAQGFGGAPTSALPATLPPAQTAGTPQSPAVINDTLCWRGPGPTYEVISAVTKGTAVDMLGRGSIAGWYIIRNPIYGDPCWLQSSDLQIPAGYDVTALPLFNPPFTATPTASVTPLVSSTPSVTLTPAPTGTPSPSATP